MAADDDVTWVDVVGGQAGEHLDLMLALQHEYFPDYEYVPPTIIESARKPAHRDGMVYHQKVLLVDGVAAGYIIFNTNLTRRVTLGHYMAILPEFRGRGLAKRCEYHARDTGVIDTAEHGTSLIAYVAECEPHLLPLFTDWGFTHLPVDYAEPYHGARWVDYGEPQFFERLLVALPGTDSTLDVATAARACAAAFLLDHYELPTTNSVVTRCLP